MKNNQSVERALAVLEFLDSREEGMVGAGVNEIARRLGLTAPTAHNFLQTLVRTGYVEQDEHAKYRLAERTRWLGWNGRRKLALLQAARPHAERLAWSLNEVVIVCGCSGRIWQTLLKIESSRMLTARSGLPATENFYISATGRCILSQFSETELEQHVRRFRLPTPQEWAGADTRDGLQTALETIRRNRYELYRAGDGIVGVGAVIRPFGSAAVGALGVIIPESRFRDAHRDAVIDGVLSAATRIGRDGA